MPKLKQPATLQKLAVEFLGHTVAEKAVEAIASGVNINTSVLHDYLYGELPDVLSQEIAAHMLAEVAGTLTNGDYNKTDVSDTTKRFLLGIVYNHIRILELRNAPRYAEKTLSCNIQTFQKLHTFIVKDYFMEADVAETFAAGLRSLKCLVNFQMPHKCTDAIIQTLGSCCYGTIEHIHVNWSERVTDASFNSLLECRKLKHFSIYDTSNTAEGLVQFLQHRNLADTAEGFLGLSVGSDLGWDVSSRYLDEIALCCPMLKRLEICGLRLYMLALVSITKLEALEVHDGKFNECRFECFLRLRGCSITALTLYFVGSVDLACIVNHCVNIRRLSVADGSTCLMGILETAPKACQYLESLDLCCEFSPSSIEGMLYACVNVTSLVLYPDFEHITDELVLRVLSKNPLQKLTDFSASLTMRAVDAIIEHCPLLEKVCCPCDRMTEAEVEILRQKIKNGNLNLKTCFSADYFPW